ncbi:TonB-dependent receptor [Piscinibacter sakaiensis]|uniref:TonB-dependent receptor plug domain-containing protein n=1 Tax=Piscinibacter sakaiensis TaxID=1547922 RepID=UPI00372B75DF
MFQKKAISAAAALALCSLGLTAEVAWAQQAQTLERVEITGSALRRVDAETALPVTVIKVDDLIKQGVTSAEGAMARIAANQSSFGTSRSIGGTTGGKAEADLRGLNGPTGGSAGKTLVLLNGRRLSNHPFDAAAVDLNSIPLAAVDRIEVLRDGASSLYGTDAIGGVINFVLKRDYRGLEVGFEKQAPRQAGGDTTRFNLTGGFGSLSENRFNILASVDIRKQDVLEAAQRKFAATGVLQGNVVAGTSGSSFPGDVGGFEPSLPNCNPPSSIPNPAGTACRYDFTRDIDLIPENKQVTGVVKGTFAIAPEHTVSLEALSSKNTTTSRVAPSPVSHLIPASSPFYPAGAPREDIPNLLSNDPNATVPGGVVNWRQVPAGKRTSGNETTADRVVLEFQGTVGTWDYRAAAGTARSKTTESVKLGYVNDDIMQDGIFRGIINPFGPQTAAGAAFIDTAQVRDVVAIGKNQVDFVDARVTTDLMQMAAGPLALAIGAEYRREKSNFENLPITGSLGSLGLDPDADTAGSRKVSAVYAELGVPVVKGLDLTLSGRYDKYSDFGSSFNPKIGLRYQPSRQVLVRGSVNTGFRAPSLYEIYQPASLTFTTDNCLRPAGAAPRRRPGRRRQAVQHARAGEVQDLQRRYRLRSDAADDLQRRRVERVDPQPDQQPARAGGVR